RVRNEGPGATKARPYNGRPGLPCHLIGSRATTRDRPYTGTGHFVPALHIRNGLHYGWPMSLFIAFCRLLLAGIFWVVVRLFWGIEIHGLEHAKRDHPVYFAMLHKRDLDPLIEAPTVLARHRWRSLAGDVQFALRGDAFLPGFLGIMVRRPRWLSRFLRILSLGTVLRALGFSPLENLYILPTEMWIREWLAVRGDANAGEVLTPAFLAHIAAMSDEELCSLQACPLSHLLTWHYHDTLQPWSTASIFTEVARPHARQAALKKLKQELDDLSSWLARGKHVWGAPEGQLSADGTIHSITSIPYRLLQKSPPETDVMPISISYDFMTTRRTRVFVNLAPAIEQAPSLSARALETRLHAAWRLSTYFTCTQLASGFLVQKLDATNPVFALDDLVAHLYDQAVQLVRAGRYVDRRLLSPRKVRKLAKRFLRYVQRHHMIKPAWPQKWIPAITDLSMEVRPGDVGYRDAPLAYAWNELQDLLKV
ncbi:MAG TPA: hypothetical protein VH593_32945, partial [Ktedonobacteraceae bacterium]